MQPVLYILDPAAAAPYVSVPAASRGDSKKKPLIVLLGWVNAQDRHLAKYSTELAAHGYSSVRAIQPTPTGFSAFQSSRDAWAQQLLARVAADHPHKRVVLYAFSNGGAWVVESTWLLVTAADRLQQLRRTRWRHRYLPQQQQVTLPRIAGIIFDSCPAYMHWAAGMEAIQSTLAPLQRVLTVALYLFVYLPLTWLLTGYRPARFWRHMQEFSFRGDPPELYLFSHTDRLCDAGRLQELMALRRNRGAHVTSVSWPDSPHVAHARAYPADYWQAVLGFLQKL